jgi:hypothetical protein
MDLAFRRATGVVENSRIFKDLVKLLCTYDSVLHEHFHCINENVMPDCSFKHEMQNELMELMGNKVNETEVKKQPFHAFYSCSCHTQLWGSPISQTICDLK